MAMLTMGKSEGGGENVSAPGPDTEMMIDSERKIIVGRMNALSNL